MERVTHISNMHKNSNLQITSMLLFHFIVALEVVVLYKVNQRHDFFYIQCRNASLVLFVLPNYNVICTSNSFTC